MSLITSFAGAPAAPVIGTVIQPTCADATGSITLNGLPDGNWTVNPGARTGSGTSTTITGLAYGTYSFSVTNEAGCISPVSSNVLISKFPGSPDAPSTGTLIQPTCEIATGSVLLAGLPAGNWTINPGAISGSGTGTTVTGLAMGTYNFTVANSSGCISAPTADVVIVPFPGAPTAPVPGIVTQPSCDVPTGSVVLTGLPSGNWTVNPGTLTGNGASITITGLAAGTHNFSVTSESGCVSPVSSDIVVNFFGQAIPTAELSNYNGFNISCYGKSDGHIRMSYSGDITGYIFNWSGPDGFTSSAKDIEGLKAGQYILSVTDTKGCITTQSYDLKEQLQLDMTVDLSVSSDGGYNLNCA